MELKITVHHHYHLGGELHSLLRDLKSQGERIMATQAQLAAQVTELGEQLNKIFTEVTGLKTQVTDLETAIANAGNVTPELQAAFDAVKARVATIDELVEDAPTP